MSARNCLAWLLVLLAASLVACGGGDDKAQKVTIEAVQDGVFTLSVRDERETLPAPGQEFLGVGEGLDVDEQGRAIVRFSDLLTVEVLRDGELLLKEMALDEQSAVVTVLQRGGVLLNDWQPEEEIAHRFTVETGFATITATGTRFVVAFAENGSRVWVLALEAEAGDLQVRSEGVTETVASGQARLVARDEQPGDAVRYDREALDAWLEDLRGAEPSPQRIDVEGILRLDAPQVLLQGQGQLSRGHPEDTYSFDVPAGVLLTVKALVAGDKAESEVMVGLYRDEKLLNRMEIRQGTSGGLARVLSDVEGGEYVLLMKRFDGEPEYEFSVIAASQTDGGRAGDAGGSEKTALPIQVNAATLYGGQLGDNDIYDYYRFDVPGGVILTADVLVAGGVADSQVFVGLYRNGKLQAQAHPKLGERGTLAHRLNTDAGGEYVLLVKRSHGDPVYEFSVTTQTP